MIALLILLATQEPYTIGGEGKLEQTKEGPTIVLHGKTNLPDTAALGVTLGYGEPGRSKTLGQATVVDVKSGVFTATFRPFQDKVLPGAYTFEVVFSILNQQGDVRKRMGPKFREYRATIAATIGTADDLAAVIAERRRDLASKVSALEDITREAEEHFHRHVNDREKARWGERQTEWVKRVDAALGGSDRPDNLLVPDGERIVELLARLHEDVEGFMAGLGRVLTKSQKPETWKSVLEESNKLAEKFRYVKILAGAVPGTTEDLAAAMRTVMSAVERAAEEKGSEESRRAFHAAALAAAKLTPRQAQAALAEACAKSMEAIEGRASVDDAILMLGDIVAASRKHLPK